MNCWRSRARPEDLVKRATLIRALREFLDQRGLIEVQTPLVTASGVTDPHIESLALARNHGFLRSSPEYCHKRLLAGGFGDLYELGPVFRAGEHGRLHRTEFTLLEWYRLSWGWRELATEVLDLIQHALDRVEQARWAIQWLDWCESFERAGLPDPLQAGLAEIESVSEELPSDCDRDMRLDYLFATRIQPRLPASTLSVIHGYPASQAALARLDPNDPRKAERFEIFAGDVELANGYHELSDCNEQRRRFEKDRQKRQALGRPDMAADEGLLAALAHGLPDCSGVALGVDRLIMVGLNLADIEQVRPFS